MLESQTKIHKENQKISMLVIADFVCLICSRCCAFSPANHRDLVFQVSTVFLNNKFFHPGPTTTDG